jgi:putative transposase
VGGRDRERAVCQSLLANLQSRGLRTDRSLLVILDGAKALHKATRAVFGEAALIQRCQVHKLRNILDHLPERQRPWVQAIVRRAYQATDVKTATRLLTDLAKRLEDEYPSAAGSVREGLDETLTVLTLQLSARLQRSLATTNAAESLLSRTRHVKRNVKRWRGGQMMLRWVAAGVLEAVKGFRRLKGHADMPRLVAALRARDQRLGSVSQWRTSRRISTEPPPNFNSGRDIPLLQTRVGAGDQGGPARRRSSSFGEVSPKPLRGGGGRSALRAMKLAGTPCSPV